MSKRFGKVWSALRPSIVMVLTGIALATSNVAAANPAPMAAAHRQQQADSLRSPLIAMLPVFAAGANGHAVSWFAWKPAPAKRARSYALLSSSLGMLSMVAWLRLNRPLS